MLENRHLMTVGLLAALWDWEDWILSWVFDVICGVSCPGKREYSDLYSVGKNHLCTTADACCFWLLRFCPMTRGLLVRVCCCHSMLVSSLVVSVVQKALRNLHVCEHMYVSHTHTSLINTYSIYYTIFTHKIFLNKTHSLFTEFSRSAVRVSEGLQITVNCFPK